MPIILLEDMDGATPRLIEPVIQEWNGVPRSVIYSTLVGSDFAAGLAPVLGRYPNASSGNILTVLQFTGVGGVIIDFVLNFSSTHFHHMREMFDRFAFAGQLVNDQLNVPVYFSGLHLELVFDAASLNILFSNVQLEIAGSTSQAWNTIVTFNFLEDPDNKGNWGWADNSPINPGNDG